MGNFNSRETKHILDNENIKTLCKNLAELFRSHGEYLQHRRRRRSRSHRDRSYHKDTNDRGKRELRGITLDLLKAFLRECPAEEECPGYRWVTAQFGGKSLEPRGFRRHGDQDRRSQSYDSRNRLPYPPERCRGPDLRGLTTDYLPNRRRNGILQPIFPLKYTVLI